MAVDFEGWAALINQAGITTSQVADALRDPVTGAPQVSYVQSAAQPGAVVAPPTDWTPWILGGIALGGAALLMRR